MDNFDDFTPSGKSSSTLASIFGKSSNAAESSSLIYTPTKQPKREASPKKGMMPESTAPSANKLELILFKSVHAYKLSSGAYQPIGKMGLALVGCQSPAVYQLLLYKTKEEVVCKIRINSSNVFSILDNNYASFYSDDQINYSVMFETGSDIEAFALQYAVIKGALSSELVVQDLLFSTGNTIPENSQIRVKVTPYQLLGDKAKPVADEEEIEVNLAMDGNQAWVHNLRGIKFGAKRIVILPKEYNGPWREYLDPQAKLLLRIEIPKKPRVETISSSGEESASFKEKGAIIEGAIAGKSQKSGLLSRVARLGQATLPLKGAVAADVTDSEDDSSPSPKPRTRVKPPTANLRALPLRTVEKPVESVAVYQYPQQNLNPGYGTLVSTTTASLLSPLDSSLSAHFSESRTQAAELRMSLSKVSDKVDVVINKLEKVNNSQSQNIIFAAPTDGAGILASVQALVEENKKLRDKAEEQKIKIDAQSERIYHLLELSHKSLEQNSTIQKPHDDQLLRKNISDLEDKLEKSQNETVNVSQVLETVSNALKSSQLEVSELSAQLSVIGSEKSDLEQKRNELLDELQQSRSENLRLENELSDVENQKESSQTADLEIQCKQLTGELNSMKQLVQQSENLQTKLDEITIENTELKRELDGKSVEILELKNLKTDCSDTKALMNNVYKKLHSEFQAESQYSGTAIKQVLASVIKELTLEFLQQPTAGALPKLEGLSDNAVAPPVQLASQQGTHQETGAESPTLNKLDHENQITYNQVWRTNEPPPLPTFDEEDENIWC